MGNALQIGKKEGEKQRRIVHEGTGAWRYVAAGPGSGHPSLSGQKAGRALNAPKITNQCKFSSMTNIPKKA
ncbi:hypothetical protein [Allofranklinella schreckenbergeri]|uniref:hypothetical protein n=1 Tax=Allofranklinella schreckenbergeri TaxID=1076744 RepID=UPI0011C3AC62|nr:hypothetical protein [Allofranklinella schreckenbergeri]